MEAGRPPLSCVRADAVVLAGGSGRRLGGADKAALDIGGRSSLQRVLDALVDVAYVVVVGPRQPSVEFAGELRWAREHPGGSGPAAALRAGVALTSAPLVLVLATDAPLVDAVTVGRLCAAVEHHDGALLVDADGRDQPLLGAYRRCVIAGRPGEALRTVFAGLDLVRLPDVGQVSLDVDTEADLARVRARLAR